MWSLTGSHSLGASAPIPARPPGRPRKDPIIAGFGWLAAYWLLAAEFARSLATPTICMETLARSHHVGRTSAVLGLWRENYDAYPLCCRPTNAMRRQPSWWTRRENLLECPLLIRPLRERAINFDIVSKTTLVHVCTCTRPSTYRDPVPTSLVQLYYT